MRPKTLLGVALAVALLASFTGSATADDVVRTPSTPISDNGVVPYIQDPAGPGGNLDCDAVAEFDFESERTNYPDDFNGPIPLLDGDANVVGTVAVTVTNGTFVAFEATIPIGAAIVKGGNDANVYEYDPQVVSDSGLASPENPSGGPAGLSNITFCANPEPPPDEGQWCSPGYWRQAHHLGSWEATGIEPDEAYNGYFDPDLAGDPTLWDVLQSPQTYGGAAFNNVGDLLSTAHPDVAFDGERVEDSCPLNGGGAGGRPETAGPASGGQGGPGGPPPGKGPQR